jgi:hypothetical protein
MPFVSPIYNISLGSELGKVPTSRFTGVPVTGLLANTDYSVFFSPSFGQILSGNQIDVDYVEVTVRATEAYYPPIVENRIVFSWGPGSTTTTNSVYVTAPKAYTIVSTMVQTIPPGPTTIFKIL